MSKVARLEQFGPPEVIQIVDVQDDQPGPDEVRLRVKAIGLNRTEVTLRSGRNPITPTLPARIGFEAAGEIEAVGVGVTGLKVGDRVALGPTYSASQYGLYGETSLAPARSLLKLDDRTSFVDAAATWVAFGTAWSGLISAGHLAPKQTVAISAASSSVGLAAIQIANRVGARPIALTRTSKKAEALLAHGASAVIALEEQDVETEIKRLTDNAGVDLVLDAVGGVGFPKLVRATRNGGLVLLYGVLDTHETVIPPFDLFARDVAIRGFNLPATARDPQKLQQLAAYVRDGLNDGSLSPTIARVFPFEEIVAAHRFIASGEQFGKVVVTVEPSH